MSTRQYRTFCFTGGWWRRAIRSSLCASSPTSFYILGVLFVVLSAKKLAGTNAWWLALVVGFVWPFAFQYGRITGWYCCSFFLVAAVTWLYLVEILEERGRAYWIAFTITAVVMAWTNYFAIATLLLLLADLLLFHRNVARRHRIALLVSVAAVAVSYLAAPSNGAWKSADPCGWRARSGFDWKAMIAEAGYTLFSIFGSVAVAPWFLPLSIPIFAATLALLFAVWFSAGRGWLVYFAISLVLLALSGHMDVKRVLFLLPWLFIAMVLAVRSSAMYPRLATVAVATLVIAGWIGIVSGRHYATTNLLEPWSKVADVVADDARHGSTVVSDSFPFFFLHELSALGLRKKRRPPPGPILRPMSTSRTATEFLSRMAKSNGSTVSKGKWCW